MSDYKMELFSSILYEKYLSKFDEILKLNDRLFNYKQGADENLSKVLFKIIDEGKWNIKSIYGFISAACNCNQRYIEAYWGLFLEIYQHFKIKPKFVLLVPPLKNIAIDYYRHNEQIDLKAKLLELFPDPMINCIIHDDSINLIEYFNSDKALFKNSSKLISNCCKYGALSCFRFLRSNGVKLTKYCLDMSVFGKNSEIIDECIKEFTPNNTTMKECIKTNNINLAIYLHQTYNINFFAFNAIFEYYNFPLYIYSLSSFKSNFIKSLRFGIKDLIVDELNAVTDLNKRTKQSEEALFELATLDIDYFSLLADYGANVNCCGYPLAVAAQENNVESVYKLLELGADIELSNPLIYAIISKSREAAKVLIEANTNVNACDEMGRTPLGCAANNGDLELAECLIKHGADVQANFSHALISSAEMTSLFIKYGADANDKQCIFERILCNDVNTSKVLIEAGIDLEVRDINENTPLLLAVKNRSESIAMMLIDHGANLEVRDKYGNTPLIIAAKYKSSTLYDYLIEKGANPNAKDINGKSAFEIHKETIEYYEKLSKLPREEIFLF